MLRQTLLAVFLVATVCNDVVLGDVTEAEKDEILREHNRLRSDVNPSATNMQKMYWNDFLADGAQTYSEKCRWRHNTHAQRDQGWGWPIGQNLASRWTQGVAPTWTWAIASWEGEKDDWEYGVGELADPRYNPVGHYTQAVKHNAVLVGCGYTACPGYGPNKFHFFVCEYAVSQIPRDIPTPYISGSPCADCPQANCVDNMCDCGGRFCKNYGTLDMNTCTCHCKTGYAGIECENTSFDCDKATEWPGTWCKYVTTMKPARCNIIKWAFRFCAKTCGYCPDL